jgi:hypothetical protein
MWGESRSRTKRQKTLHAEVDIIKQLRVWELMNGYFNKLVQDKVFNQSQDITDLIFGKTILYTLDVQRKIMDNIQTGRDANARRK